MVFHQENLPTEKYTLSRRDFESSLESYQLDHMFEQYKKSDESKKSKKLIFSSIAKGMYQNPNFAPKKEIMLDDGRIFYLGERVSMYGTHGITECCAIYAVVNNTIEAWVFTKSEDGKWKSMPNTSDKGPQKYFSKEE